MKEISAMADIKQGETQVTKWRYNESSISYVKEESVFIKNDLQMESAYTNIRFGLRKNK